MTQDTTTRPRTGRSRPSRSTPARPRTSPPTPGPCRSTRPRPTPSTAPSTPPTLFGLAELGNIYTRIMNPTQDVVEQRIAALEGGVAALFLASGQAAETLRDPQPRRAPATTSCPARGSTAAPTTCSTTRCPSSASRSRFVEDPDDLDSWRAAVRPNTKAFFAETISNPQIDILDIPGVAGGRARAGVPLIVDNTVATPYLIRPIELRRRHRRALGDQVPRRPRHGDRRRDRRRRQLRLDATASSPASPRPTRATTAWSSPELGAALGATSLKARVQLLRDLGSAASPFNAFLVAQGLETLSLRIERHVANAQKVAEYLAGHDDVVSVNYAGLPTSPWYELAKKYAPKGTGAVLAFELAGRRRGGQGVRQRADAAQPRRQHRRRAVAGDPPGVDDARAAHPRGAAGHRRHARAGAARGRHRGHRRHPRRPRAGLRRRQAVQCAGSDGPARPRRRSDDACSRRRATATLPAEGEVGLVDIGSLTLENGAVVDDVTIAVQRWGELSPNRDNVVVVLHALTGDSHVTGPAGPGDQTPGWWDGVAGPGAPIDTDRWCAIATNVLGGLPRVDRARVRLRRDGKPWGSRFPAGLGARPGGGRHRRAGRAGHHRGRRGGRRLDGRRAGAGVDRRPSRRGACGAGAGGRRTRDRRPDRHPEHAGRGDQVRPGLAERRLLRHRPVAGSSACRSRDGSRT